MDIVKPYLLFLGDAPDALAVKTGAGIVDWRRDWCVGQLRLPHCNADLGLADMTIEEGRVAGAKTLVIGVVNAGGVLPNHWVTTIVSALDNGMDVASGLHTKLTDIAAIDAAAKRNKRTLHDVRVPDFIPSVGKGNKRSGRRLLTVGTDCSVGKKYTALALERDMKMQGFDVTFRATGQTGIFISGRGLSIDAIAGDFISGAIEWIAPDAAPNHWDVIEGQGSLFHPSFAGVSLGLLHGAQADAFVVCHEPTRKTMRNVDFPLPTIDEVIELTINCGQRTNADIRCFGLAINTAAFDDDTAQRYLDAMHEHYSLPACDPLRYGAMPLINHLMNLYGAP